VREASTKFFLFIIVYFYNIFYTFYILIYHFHGKNKFQKFIILIISIGFFNVRYFQSNTFQDFITISGIKNP